MKEPVADTRDAVPAAPTDPVGRRPVDLSVVVPVYNEASGLRSFQEALSAVLDGLDLSSEVILVDDGSTDASFSEISAFSKADSRFRGVSLSRNFGHQVALTAGIDHALGRSIVTMDADLQHPPDVIPRLLEQHRLGYDVVYTVRIDSADTGFLKRSSSRLFYRLINVLSDIHIESGAADFRLLGPKAVEAYRRFSERGRFTRGLISWMGFRQVAITYSASPRRAGKSKYTIRRMALLAADGITAFSSKPLRISFLVGLLLLLLSIVYAAYTLFVYFTQTTVPGWTSLLLSVLIIGATQLLSLGILGEYVARIFEEVKNRPLYFVQSETNQADAELPETLDSRGTKP